LEAFGGGGRPDQKPSTRGKFEGGRVAVGATRGGGQLKCIPKTLLSCISGGGGLGVKWVASRKMRDFRSSHPSHGWGGSKGSGKKPRRGERGGDSAWGIPKWHKIKLTSNREVILTEIKKKRGRYARAIKKKGGKREGIRAGNPGGYFMNIAEKKELSPGKGKLLARQVPQKKLTLADD